MVHKYSLFIDLALDYSKSFVNFGWNTNVIDYGAFSVAEVAYWYDNHLGCVVALGLFFYGEQERWVEWVYAVAGNGRL